MSGYCATGNHTNCPDSTDDTGACSCPCHLLGDSVDALLIDIPLSETDPEKEK